jgi:hypothetical protein
MFDQLKGSSPVTDGEVPRVEATELPELAEKTNGVHNHTAASPDSLHDAVEDAFKLSSQYGYAPRKIKVFTIGAGFSGLLIAHKLQHRFPEMQDMVEHTIFEALPEVGGTWFVNNYPGVQCDVPAHIYVSHTPASIPSRSVVFREKDLAGGENFGQFKTYTK